MLLQDLCFNCNKQATIDIVDESQTTFIPSSDFFIPCIEIILEFVGFSLYFVSLSDEGSAGAFNLLSIVFPSLNTKQIDRCLLIDDIGN